MTLKEDFLEKEFKKKFTAQDGKKGVCSEPRREPKNGRKHQEISSLRCRPSTIR